MRTHMVMLPWRGAVAALNAIVAIGLAVPANAEGWPPLRHGVWEITRTMDAPGGGAPKVVTVSRCMTPGDDWDRQHAQLRKAGCTFSSVEKDAGGYWFTSRCKTMGIDSSSKTTIVPEGDSAFTLTVVGTTGGTPMREVMKARRTADCAK